MSNSYLRGVKIIGGKWRGRSLKVLQKKGLRPSSSRARETLFNWLSPYIIDATCLDVFSGSGALAFESLSRGAGWVTMVDHDPDVVYELLRKSQEMGQNTSEVIESDALKWLSVAQNRKYDIVYLDPPFDKGLLKPILNALSEGWLSDDALVYVEQKRGVLDLGANWEIKKMANTNKVKFALLMNR